MFRRRGAGATDGTAQDSPGAQSPDGPADVKQPRSAAEAAKGRPTPKRSEAERKRYQPITGSRAPAAPRTPEEKQKARSERTRRYEAMRQGQEWALNPRDRGPARALARDFVDSKRRVSEYYMYVLIVLVVALFARNKTAQDYISPLILVLVVVIVIDAQLIRRGLTKLVAERLPGESTRGLTMYAVMRALQIRRFRVPVPRVHPGDKILGILGGVPSGFPPVPSAPIRSSVGIPKHFSGRIRACGSIRGTIVHQILPGTRIFQDLFAVRQIMAHLRTTALTHHVCTGITKLTATGPAPDINPTGPTALNPPI